MALTEGAPESLRSAMKASEFQRSFMRTTAGSLSIQVAATLLGFAISIIITRSSGASPYGVYTLATAMATLLAIPAQFGIPDLLVRQTARYKVQERWDKLRGILLRANQAVIANSLLIGFTGLILVFNYQSVLSADQMHAFILSLLLVPFVSLGALRMATLQGLNYPILGQVADQVVRPTVIILMLLASICMFGQQTLAAKNILIIAASAAVVSFLIGTFLLFTKLPKEVKLTHGSFNDKEWARTLLPFTVMAGTQVFNTKLDIIMLGYMRDTHETGLYAVATKIALLIVFARMAIVRGVAPMIATLWAKQERKNVQRIATMAARVGFSFSIIIALPVLVLSDDLLSMVFGPEFVKASPALLILCTAWLFSLATGVSNTVLKMSGYEKYSVWGLGIAATANVLLNVLLIPVYGINGAAIATAISLVCQSTYLYIQAYRYPKIEASVLGLTCKRRPMFS